MKSARVFRCTCKRRGVSLFGPLPHTTRMSLSLIRMFALVSLVAAALSVPTAAAQAAPDPRKDARVHVGPFYLTPTLALKDLGIDTNVFSSQTNPKRDFTFVVAPGTSLFVPMANRAVVKADLGVDFVYYKQYASERSIDPDVKLRADFLTPHLDLFVDDAFLSTRQRLNYEIDLRMRQQHNTYGGGFAIKFSPRTRMEFAARGGRHRFDGDASFNGTSLQQVLDHDTTSYSANLISQRTMKTKLTLLMEVAHDRFLHTAARNSDSVRVLPGVEFSPRALVTGRATLGFRRFQTLSPTVPDFSGVVTSVDLGYTLLGSTHIGVQADRDVAYSYDRSQSYYLVNGLGGSLRRQLFGRADAIVGGKRYRYDYRSTTAAAVALPVETTTNLNFDLGYRMRNSTRIGVAVSRWVRSSSLSTSRDYRGWRYGVSVTYGQ